jgi:hypothetical protein
MKVTAVSHVHDHVVDEHDNQNLTPGRTYLVYEINNDSFRVCNDKEEPILYPKELFRVIDNSIPSGWIMVDFGDGEYSLGPREVNKRGFFERYFDGENEEVEAFAGIILQSNSW